jgi:hypothetical protein
MNSSWRDDGPGWKLRSTVLSGRGTVWGAASHFVTNIRSRSATEPRNRIVTSSNLEKVRMGMFFQHFSMLAFQLLSRSGPKNRAESPSDDSLG